MVKCKHLAHLADYWYGHNYISLGKCWHSFPKRSCSLVLCLNGLIAFCLSWDLFLGSIPLSCKYVVLQVLRPNMLTFIVRYVSLSTKIDRPLKFQMCSVFQILILFIFSFCHILNGYDLCLFVTFPGLCWESLH